MVRHPSFSPTSTMTRPESAISITFHSDDGDMYDVPSTPPSRTKDLKGPKLGRSNTTNGTKKSTASSKWGYGWGVGKKDKEKGKEVSMDDEEHSSQVNLPLYQPMMRRDSKSTQVTRSTQRTQDTHRSQDSQRTQETYRSQDSHRTQGSQQTKVSQHSKDSSRSGGSRSTMPMPRPPLTGHVLYPQDSTATLVGSAFERKINDFEPIRIKPDTTDRLDELRRLMLKDNLDY
jgi:Xaa-Pro aminopeptidase